MTTSPTDPVWDVAVIGAGPAGLAASAAAAEAGRSVVLIDAGAAPGGQYWRNATAAGRRLLHHGLDDFDGLRARLQNAGVTLLAQHHVRTLHQADGVWQLSCLLGAEPRESEKASTVRARRLVLATGAYDRQLPFPGWDLPGVLTGGGVQAMLKQHGVAAGRRAVVAGTGPFLLAVADGLVRSGSTVAAVVDANSAIGFVRHPAALVAARGKLAEGAGFLARLNRHRPGVVRHGHVVVRALGADRLEAVEIARLRRDGTADRSRRVACDVLAVGWGFTAQLELHRQAGCELALGDDGGLAVVVDGDQQTTKSTVWAAGESTGVGGAELAVVEGEIAGRSAAGVPPLRAHRSRRARLTTFARAMHAVYPLPVAWLSRAADDVVICRCEEVAVGAVRDAVRTWGATDARTVKLLARPGMGWCQGRTCGLATALLTASACGREVAAADLAAFAERPFSLPSSLRSLLADGPSERVTTDPIGAMPARAASYDARPDDMPVAPHD
ncbi:MAG: D-hydroxyproline dehydrogenase subunit alpha [Actinomycetota bacterium]|jgi:thioredoxin reductase|nr:D-hydroxyproline dehydrogenase subunit alpha [Actinomycetota bacterium]